MCADATTNATNEENNYNKITSNKRYGCVSEIKFSKKLKPLLMVNNAYVFYLVSGNYSFQKVSIFVIGLTFL